MSRLPHLSHYMIYNSGLQEKTYESCGRIMAYVAVHGKYLPQILTQKEYLSMIGKIPDYAIADVVDENLRLLAAKVICAINVEYVYSGYIGLNATST